MLSKPSEAGAPDDSGSPVAVEADRRSEPRQPATGAVRLRQGGEMAAPFQGHLLDTAPTGFRARHDRLSLASGQLVDFEFTGRKGVARAIWTRIVDGHAETGFRILPQEGD